MKLFPKNYREWNFQRRENAPQRCLFLFFSCLFLLSTFPFFRLALNSSSVSFLSFLGLVDFMLIIPLSGILIPAALMELPFVFLSVGSPSSSPVRILSLLLSFSWRTMPSDFNFYHLSKWISRWWSSTTHHSFPGSFCKFFIQWFVVGHHHDL